MTRFRLVSTPMWSQDHLVRALAQVGYAGAEAHADPVALESWRGLPLAAHAHIVVRRKAIGAASDDFGFVLNARGTFDAVQSEIHFFRFARRWLEDLTRRHDELAAADGLPAPDGLDRSFATRNLDAHEAPPDLPVPTRAGRVSEAQLQREAAQARAAATLALSELRGAQKKADKFGCALSLFGPVVLWIVVSSALPDVPPVASFAMIVVPMWVALGLVRAVRLARRARVAAAALLERLPSTERAREAAQTFLETQVKPIGAKAEDGLVKELLKALREPRT